MTRDDEALLSSACIAVTHVTMRLMKQPKEARLLTDKHRAMLLDVAHVLQLGAELVSEYVNEADANANAAAKRTL